MVDESSQRGSGGGSGSSMNWDSKSPDELVTHAKQVFAAIGNLDQTQQDRIYRDLRADPTSAKVFDRLMEPTG
jgi:hypothetical protein